MHLSHVAILLSSVLPIFASPIANVNNVVELGKPLYTVGDSTYQGELSYNEGVTTDLAESREDVAKRQTGPTGYTTGAALKSQMLSYHNAYRAHHNASAMTWNSTLASYALVSAKKCVFAHTANGIYGENIAGGTMTNPAYYVYAWYNEVSKYNYTNPGYSDSVGHFTQLVWKASTSLGCAWVVGCSGSLPNMLFCEYSPRGNILPSSNFATQVGKPQATPANPAVPNYNA